MHSENPEHAAEASAGQPAVPIKAIVEAALLAAGHPLTVNQLTALFDDQTPVDSDAVRKALEALASDCTTRGVELVEVASGFRFQVRRDIHPWVSRLWTERQSRYSRALLETLALIAYRQPITRGEIEQIRGVAVNSQIIKTLEEREWVRVVGHRDVPGRPELLGTTRGFLDYFGLKSLDQLPPLAELRELTDLEPELPFDLPRPASIDPPAQSSDDPPEPEQTSESESVPTATPESDAIEAQP
ncbi:MAG: SMC-Scp complex subunit ScpB, partial [Gammaproteobacteria bacterium HGW-Gammaproteobacteria-7]